MRLALWRLMALVALAGLCLAATRAHPGLGAAAGLGSTLALARTAAGVGRWRARGRRVSLGWEARLLLDSLAAVAALLVGCLAGFVGALVVALVPTWGSHGRLTDHPVEVGIGLLGAVVVGSWLVRRLWPLRVASGLPPDPRHV